MSMIKSQGRLLVVEGLEGAGKSTVIQTIESILKEKKQTVLLTREPGGTRVGEWVRSLIKEHVPGESLDPRTELLMLYAARVQHIEQVIKPALNQGIWVVSDRFELSTIAYQGGGRGLPLEMINQVSAAVLQGFKPDITIFLDIDPSKGLERVLQRGDKDRMEQESILFFQRVNDAYHQAILGMDDVIQIDASQPLLRVQATVIAYLEQLLESYALS